MRGGKRTPGPGKSLGAPVLGKNKRIKTSINLRPDHYERLRGKNLSNEIEIALDNMGETMKKIKTYTAWTKSTGQEVLTEIKCESAKEFKEIVEREGAKVTSPVRIKKNN